MVKQKISQKRNHQRPQTNDQLLMINYYFPPVKSVGSLRVGNFYLEARKYFSKISLLTTRHQHIFAKDIWKKPLPHTYYVPSYDFRYFCHLAFGSNVNSFSYQSKKHPLQQLLIKLLDSFPLNVLLNDGGLWYILRGYQKGCQLVKDHEITHLFSSFKPYSDHLIAYLLKCRFPHLFWIADFRDLQTDPNRNNVIWPKLQHQVNKLILKKADQVTAVSRSYANYLERYEVPTYCLRNGIASDALKAPSNKVNEKFTISYTGSVYPALQDASPVFQAIKALHSEGQLKLEQLDIQVAGNDMEVWKNWAAKYELAASLSLNGLVSHTQAVKIQRDSDINLLLSWSTPKLSGVLTGKLYEYLSAQKPILALINGSRDTEFDELFAAVNAGPVIYKSETTIEELKSFILQRYQSWKAHHSADWPFNTEALEKLSWAYQMETFASTCLRGLKKASFTTILTPRNQSNK